MLGRKKDDKLTTYHLLISIKVPLLIINPSIFHLYQTFIVAELTFRYRRIHISSERTLSLHSLRFLCEYLLPDDKLSLAESLVQYSKIITLKFGQTRFSSRVQSDLTSI